MKIEKWNDADIKLYKYFKDRFWKEVEKQGPGFFDDVNELKRKRKFYAGKCIEDEAIEQAYSHVYVKGYKMRTNLQFHLKQKCEMMLKNEIKFLDVFKKKYSWHDRLERSHIENFRDVIKR